jgi:Zn ribbon nucleic-acid-binding protein
MTSRDLLEKQIVLDAIHSEDTTVLASLLEMLTDNQVYQALSDGNQEHYDEPEVEPSDCTGCEHAVEIIANNLMIMVKNNDVGVSVDYYSREPDQEPFRADQVWFEDVPTNECEECGYIEDDIATHYEECSKLNNSK